jgi:hypothetical protein
MTMNKVACKKSQIESISEAMDKIKNTLHPFTDILHYEDNNNKPMFDVYDKVLGVLNDLYNEGYNRLSKN